MTRFGRVGVIGRFKPLHIGGERMLESLCENAEHVVIGIGSANKYDLRNPFTSKETVDMIDRTLKERFSNYSFRHIPDFGHLPDYANGEKWKDELVRQFGPLDAFFTGNNYVATLLSDAYPIEHCASLIPPENWVSLHATDVRYELAAAGDWQSLVPQPVAAYLLQKKLDQRFRAEFGIAALAAGRSAADADSYAAERANVTGVRDGGSA